MIDLNNNDINDEVVDDSVEPQAQDFGDETKVFDGYVDDSSEETTEEVTEEEPNGGQPPKRDNRKILIPIIVAAIVICLVLIFVMLNSRNSGSTVDTDPSVFTVNSSIDFAAYQEIWQENYAINSDYVGEIVFESGIISLPVVQYIDESNLDQGYYQYLRYDWETGEYDEEGSIFIDPYTYLDSSMNVVIYGHYVYESYDSSKTHKFTPLELLLDEENYEENSIFYLILEDEVRVYQIAHVYYAQLYSSDGSSYNLLEEGMYYMKAEWTQEELEYYLEKVSAIEQYDTGVEIEYGDNFVTLQTCVENRDDLREIVIAKQIGSFSYSDLETDSDSE